MRLDGKVVIVSGAGAGMGRACALLFAQEGARVVVVARQGERVQQTADLIQAAGGEARPVQANVSHPEEAERVVRATLDAYGRVDVLQNNAGGGFSPNFLGPGEVDLQFFDEVIANNLRSGFLMAKLVLPHMAQLGGGASSTSPPPTRRGATATSPTERRRRG